MERITILIADDHAIIREAWNTILNRDGRFEVVAECGSGEMAVELAKRLQPHIVIMDINLPGIDGFEASELILKHSPDTKILAVSVYGEVSYAMKMFQKGAMGYVTKSSSPEELFKAITEIQNGRTYICDALKNSL